MPLTVPGREDFHDEFISEYAVAQPDKSVAKGSIPWALARALSALAWMIIAKLIYYAKNLLPDTSDLTNLQRWGTVYSFPMRGAQGSSGALALRVSGTPGAPLGVLPVLTHADGTSYKVTTAGAVVGGGGTVDVDLSAISTGLATNKVTGEALTFSAPPAGVTAQAALIKNLTNGLDVETREQYRARLLAHLGDPPEGGAYTDYIEWALKVPGSATAYIWRHRRGTGTIDVAVLGTGNGSERVVTDLVPFTTYIESRRPGNVKDWRMLVTTPQTQAVTATIDIDETLYKWDWDDLGVGYQITAHSSVASTITVPSAPVTVIAGVRIQVAGEEAKVTARVGNVLTLAFTNVVWFTGAITDGVSVIRCSGDLVVPVRNAILALFANLGPARGTSAAVTWDDSIKFAKMYAAITDVSGVDDAILVLPAANVSPVDDPLLSPNAVPFLAPGVVQVLKQ